MKILYYKHSYNQNDLELLALDSEEPYAIIWSEDGMYRISLGELGDIIPLISIERMPNTNRYFSLLQEAKKELNTFFESFGFKILNNELNNFI